MGASLHKTKRRIASVNSTKKITKAMELVATVKLKKFRNVMDKNVLYSEEIANIISHLFMHSDEELEMYNKEKESSTTLYVVVNSNLGLCASYNNDIYAYVTNNVSKENTLIIPIGLKGDKFFKKSLYNVDERYVSVNERISYDDIVKLGNELNNSFLEGKYRSIKLIYTKYVNSIKFVPTEITLFPLGIEGKESNTNDDLIYDPNVKTLIEQLVPIYVNSTLYQKIIESQVSEQASRRTAMENASDNATELIDELTLEFNKARQAAITQEISEVVSGKN